MTFKQLSTLFYALHGNKFIGDILGINAYDWHGIFKKGDQLAMIRHIARRST